jgi:hypothetical protein
MENQGWDRETRGSGDHETIMRMGRLVLWESKVGLGEFGDAILWMSCFSYVNKTSYHLSQSHIPHIHCTDRDLMAVSMCITILVIKRCLNNNFLDS